MAVAFGRAACYLISSVLMLVRLQSRIPNSKTPRAIILHKRDPWIVRNLVKGQFIVYIDADSL